MKRQSFTAKKAAVLAIFTALSLITFLIENIFPPLILPGAKMGLSNIFSFAALILYGPAEAFAVIVARTVLGAAFSVNFSMLLYSFTGGIVAMTVSSLLLCLLHPRISVMAVSVAAAVMHNVTQNVVFVLVSQTPQMLAYMPYLALLGILSGAAVGGVTLLLFRKVPLNVYLKAVKDSQ